MKKTIKHLASAIAVTGFLFIAFGSDDEPSSTSVPEKVIPVMTDAEYLTYFQGKWDSVALKKQEGFLQYDTYQSQLEAILQDMIKVLERDTSFTFDSPSKVNQLRLRLAESKKMKDALKNWFTYGQPSKFDLKYACQYYLEQNANDPSSIDIEDWKVDGQSKNGWVVIAKYRGKNAFGGLVLNVSKFDIRFNPANKFYYVKNMYDY